MSNSTCTILGGAFFGGVGGQGGPGGHGGLGKKAQGGNGGRGGAGGGGGLSLYIESTGDVELYGGLFQSGRPGAGGKGGAGGSGGFTISGADGSSGAPSPEDIEVIGTLNVYGYNLQQTLSGNITLVQGD